MKAFGWSHLLLLGGTFILQHVNTTSGHCQRLHPEYDKASEALGGVVNMARVNGDEERELSQQYGVKGFPTIKIFNAGKDAKKNPEDYQSHRQAKPIVDYLMSKFNALPDPAKKLSSKDDLTSFTSDTSRSKVLLFTSKPTNPALFKSLAVEYGKSHNVDFAFVPNSNAEVKAQYDIEKEPAIVFVPTGGESVIKYDGAMKKEALSQFLIKNGVTRAGSAPKAAPKEDTTYKPKPPKAPKQVKVAEVATSAHLKTECDRMCVIGFTNNDEQNNAFFELAQKHAADSDRVRFVRLANDAAKSSAKSAFGIEQDPEEGINVVVLRASKLKYAAKAITEQDADAFFDRVLFGEYPLKKLDSLPSLEGDKKSSSEDQVEEEETTSAKTEHDEL